MISALHTSIKSPAKTTIRSTYHQHPCRPDFFFSWPFFQRNDGPAVRNQDKHEYKSQWWNTHNRNPSAAEIPPHRASQPFCNQVHARHHEQVMKNANANPKMMVQHSGFQNAALSPPRKICGLNSEKSVTKLILNPTAKE